MSASIITVSLNPTIDRVLEVDNLQLGARQVAREILRIPGGKAVNVSRVLATLGVRSIATGFLGAENRSWFEAFLSSPLVVDEFFMLPGRTRENVTIVDRSAGQETHIRDLGLPIDERNLARLEKKLHLMSRTGVYIIFSGSLPPGVGVEDFRRLVRLCNSAGARVAVDTSGEALREIVTEPLWAIKPNTPELVQLAGRELPSLDEQLAVARGLASRVNHVLFSRGREGAYLFTGELAIHGRVEVDAGRVRSSIGCGDALLGAFVAGMSRGRDVRTAFAEALACASASSFTFIPAQFETADMGDLLTRVRLTDLT